MESIVTHSHGPLFLYWIILSFTSPFVINLFIYFCKLILLHYNYHPIRGFYSYLTKNSAFTYFMLQTVLSLLQEVNYLELTSRNKFRYFFTPLLVHIHLLHVKKLPTIFIIKFFFSFYFSLLSLIFNLLSIYPVLIIILMLSSSYFIFVYHFFSHNYYELLSLISPWVQLDLTPYIFNNTPNSLLLYLLTIKTKQNKKGTLNQMFLWKAMRTYIVN